MIYKNKAIKCNLRLVGVIDYKTQFQQFLYLIEDANVLLTETNEMRFAGSFEPLLHVIINVLM